MKIVKYTLIGGGALVACELAGYFGLSAAAGMIRGKDMASHTELRSANEAPGLFELQANADGSFRLAVFTDLHFDLFDPLGTIRAKLAMRKHIETRKPDMIAVLGDTALNPFNKGRTRAFVKLMDSFGIPWTAVLGNHEGEADHIVPRREVLEYYGESSHFIGAAELPGVTGYGNQAVAVMDAEGACAHFLYFLDSGGGRGHNYIQEDQLAWMRAVAARHPGTPGMIFLHVPVYQYKDAYEALETGEAQLLRGDLREGVCTMGTREQSDALVARAKELGVHSIVCGHDHSNNFDILWQGIRYIYTQSGGYSWKCYDKRSKDARGCSVYVIQKDGGMELEQNF